MKKHCWLLCTLKSFYAFHLLHFQYTFPFASAQSSAWWLPFLSSILIASNIEWKNRRKMLCITDRRRAFKHISITCSQSGITLWKSAPNTIRYVDLVSCLHYIVYTTLYLFYIIYEFLPSYDGSTLLIEWKWKWKCVLDFDIIKFICFKSLSFIFKKSMKHKSKIKMELKNMYARYWIIYEFHFLISNLFHFMFRFFFFLCLMFCFAYSIYTTLLMYSVSYIFVDCKHLEIAS